MTSTTSTSSPPTTTSTSPTSASVTSSASSGGLSVTLTATASSTGTEFSLHVQESNAFGALQYQITYGDGTTDRNVAPQYCRSGPGQPASQTWQLSHTYTRPGTYSVSATVQAICTPDRATATVAVTVSSA